MWYVKQSNSYIYKVEWGLMEASKKEEWEVVCCLMGIKFQFYEMKSYIVTIFKNKQTKHQRARDKILSY